MIQQRRQAGPRLFVHAVAFVQEANAALNHRRHQRRGVVLDGPALAQHRRHEQIFGARVGRALIDVERLLALAGGRDRERRLADAGRSEEPRRQRQVLLIDDQPAGEDLFQDFALADPGPRRRIGGTEMQTNAVNFVNLSHVSAEKHEARMSKEARSSRQRRRHRSVVGFGH